LSSPSSWVDISPLDSTIPSTVRRLEPPVSIVCGSLPLLIESLSSSESSFPISHDRPLLPPRSVKEISSSSRSPFAPLPAFLLRLVRREVEGTSRFDPTGTPAAFLGSGFFSVRRTTPPIRIRMDVNIRNRVYIDVSNLCSLEGDRAYPCLICVDFVIKDQ